MDESEVVLHSPIRTRFLDDAYEQNAKEVSRVMSSNMTDEEKEHLESLNEDLKATEDDVAQIQDELIRLLYKKGCKCVMNYL